MIRDWTESEKIQMLSQGAEVFFTRLCMKADDFGCYHGRLQLLKSNLFPLKEDMTTAQVKAWLAECIRAGVVWLYKVDAKDFIFIPEFGQRKRTMHRKFPEPPKQKPEAENDILLTDVSNVQQAAVNWRPELEEEVRSKKGKEEEEVEEEVEEEEEGEKEKEKEIAAAPFFGVLADAWKNWEQHRKEKRAPITPAARKMQIKKLGALTPSAAVAMIEFSITNGYTGLFPPNEQKGKNGNYINAKEQATAANREYIANYYSKKSS